MRNADPRSILCLSSHFFDKLAENDGLNQAQLWLWKRGKKDINIFKKKFVLIPINKKPLHWVFCVIVNCGFIGKSKEEGSPMPCLLYMDSYRDEMEDSTYVLLLSILNAEWKRIKKETSDHPHPFNKETFPIFRPIGRFLPIGTSDAMDDLPNFMFLPPPPMSVPTQKDSVNCGVFICRYASGMLGLQNHQFNHGVEWFQKDLTQKICNGAFEFNQYDICCLRREMLILIARLSSLYQGTKSRSQKSEKKATTDKNDDADKDEVKVINNPISAKKSAPGVSSELPEGLATPQFRSGVVSIDEMEYLQSLKGELDESNFVKLTQTKSENGSHGGGYYYLQGCVKGWQDHPILKQKGAKALERFAERACRELPLQQEGYRADPGFVLTRKATAQSPHRDYQGYGDNGKKNLESLYPWVLHCPLCKEGMSLNYFPEADPKAKPLRIMIPFGTFLLARADAVHSGVFGSKGNVRLHIAFWVLQAAVKREIQELEQRGHTIPQDEKKAAILRGVAEHGKYEERKLDLLQAHNEIIKYYDPDGKEALFSRKICLKEDSSYISSLLDQYPKLTDSLGGMELKED